MTGGGLGRPLRGLPREVAAAKPPLGAEHLGGEAGIRLARGNGSRGKQ